MMVQNDTEYFQAKIDQIDDEKIPMVEMDTFQNYTSRLEETINKIENCHLQQEFDKREIKEVTQETSKEQLIVKEEEKYI